MHFIKNPNLLEAISKMPALGCFLRQLLKNEGGKVIEVNDIRVFIPSKNYEVSQAFYQELGFAMSYVSDDLSIFECNGNTFFLQRYYNKEFAENLMLQVIVPDIEAAYKEIEKINGYDFRFQPIKIEPWGKVIYLWGPSGELWHITELSR